MTALAQKFAKVMSALPARTKRRYDFVQDTYVVKNNKRCFDRGNISKLASFLLKNKECGTWAESMSKAWELAKGRKAQFVSPKISDYSFFSKGN